MKQNDSNIFSVIVLSSLLLLTSCIPREEATPFDKPPAWAKEAIWYQISVHSLDTGEQQNVIDKLDFIQSLGVNAIHINTISKSSYSEEPPISARSSITSADALFLELVQGAKQRNIKVMLDYSLQEGSLDQIRQHIFAGARRWLAPNSNGDPSDGVDGYSVDFTSALPMDFWREYRTLVRGLNPNAYLVGKMQAHSQSQQWSDELMDSSLLLQGDVFDAVVYDRSFSVARRFFANVENGISASDLVNQLDALTSGYSSDFLYASINSSAGLNTRGIVRAFSDSDNAINHPQPTLEGEHGNGNHDKETHARAKAFLAFQFTQPGAPIISVGDVVKSDKSLVTFYQSLIALRKSYPLLTDGKVSFYEMDDENNVLAYARENKDGERIYIAFNMSSKSRKMPTPLGFMSSTKVRVWQSNFPKLREFVTQGPITMRPLTATIMIIP